MSFRLITIFLLLLPISGMAEQRIKLKSSTITGNSELPKILYVVPWKNVVATEINYKLTVHGVADDVLKPIDPEEFQRQAKNYAELIKNH
ncbi:MAG: hypothetical protein KAU21_18755 [Gammaproteobacteria bacterium]|nr:hypothetical protein [Gammaproteobacteria bacterium]